MKNKYPECEKLAKVSKVSQEIGYFLNWLSNSGYVLAKRDNDLVMTVWDEDGEEVVDGEPALIPVVLGDWKINQILADYFHIDLVKVEEEKRQILEEIQNGNNPQ